MASWIGNSSFLARPRVGHYLLQKSVCPACFQIALRADGIGLVVSAFAKASSGRQGSPPGFAGTLESQSSGEEAQAGVRGAARRSSQACSPGSRASGGYLGPLFRPGIEGVSDGPFLGVLHAPPDELCVDLLFHKHPGSCCAALALVEEHSLVGTLHCQVHWREAGGRGAEEVIKSLGQDWPQLQPHCPHKETGPGTSDTTLAPSTSHTEGGQQDLGVHRVWS